MFLAVRQEDRRRFESGLTQSSMDRVEIELRHRRIGNDGHLAEQSRLLHQLAGALDDFGADVNRIRTVAKIDD